jgi:hypothetical protein
MARSRVDDSSRMLLPKIFNGGERHRQENPGTALVGGYRCLGEPSIRLPVGAELCGDDLCTFKFIGTSQRAFELARNNYEYLSPLQQLTQRTRNDMRVH